MAAQAVSNFLRKLKAFPMYKVDTRISEELRDIEKVFSLLLPHVQNAEWDELINREKEQEGRKSNDRVDISELNTWHWSVAVCAAEVEQIFIMYNFHMYNLFNTPTFYMKFLYSCHFKTDSNNVADKIRNCLSILSRSIRASPMIQAIFTLDQTSVEDCVLLLSKVSEVLTSPEMTELLLNLERTVYRQHQQWSLGNLLSNNGSTTSQIRMNFESAHMEGQVKDAIFLESAHMIDQAKEVKLFGGWSYAKGEEFLAINRSHQHQLVGNFLSNCFSYCSNFC